MLTGCPDPGATKSQEEGRRNTQGNPGQAALDRARVPGAEVLERTYEGSAGADDVALADRTRAGIPGMYSETLPDWRASSPGSGRHVCFSPVLPLRGRPAIALATRLREIVEGAGAVVRPVRACRPQ